MSFEEYANLCESIKDTGSKNEKVRILASYLRSLDPDSLSIACIFLTGEALPKGSEMDLNAGYSIIYDTIAKVSSIRSDELRSIYIKHGDLGILAEKALERRQIEPLVKIKLDLKYIYEQFKRIASLAGSGSTEEKKKILVGLLVNCSPLEAKYLVKVILNEMRIGLDEGLVELSIAKAFNKKIEDVRQALLVNGNIGYIAMLAKNDKLASAVMKPLSPVSFMLADVMFSAREIARYYRKRLISEYKYDGVRAQLHLYEKAKIFSRRLEDITRQFPEIIASALEIKHSVILDGEIVPFRDNKPLPFNELQRRLRRKEIDDKLIEDIPVFYNAYDILYLDNPLIDKTLRERKEILASIELRDPIRIVPFRLLEKEEEIEEMFNESRELGHEGLVLKDPDSQYQPGRRGRYWVKLKHEFDTIDAVIVYAEYGHGKRAGVLSDYTFAVRDNGILRIIGKAYSGLTNEEIEEMTERLKELEVRDEGYRIKVREEIVIEVAFDGIQKSERYDSGYALRFPRIKRIRYDKSVRDIDTLDKIRMLYSKQSIGR